MKKIDQPAKAPRVVWRKEEHTLTLQDEPVLTYCLVWPELERAGLGGRWINRYYVHLAKSWRLRWQRDVYWQACIELAQCRAASRVFTPWSGKLEGEVALWQDGLLSLRLRGEETRGDGRPNRVQWGDVWKVREGAPCQLKELVPKNRGWKRKIVEQIAAFGAARRAEGTCFLDGDWEGELAKHLPIHDFCLTEQGAELAFGQCVIAPAVEGNPVFCVATQLQHNTAASG